LVSISGAAVLALEIAGTRVLGPYYGVSIYLWSALITITLASLSVGYALGGRWADQGPRLGRLGWLLAGAGLWTALVPWLKIPLLRLSQGLDLRAAVLVDTLILFGPPLLLLGMVSPYAIRLKTRELGHLGRTAGDLFAVSTIASVASALATGFWLIPLLGVRRMFLSLGALLLVGAALSLLSDRRTRRGATVASAVALLSALAALVFPEERAAGVVHLEDSAYAEIRVLDHEGARYLLIDGGVHTVVGFGSGESLHRYVPVMESASRMFDAPGRMLLIGLGGGILVQSYAELGWEIDAVEIDPAVVTVARDHFGLEPGMAEVHALDGRLFLRSTEESWDLILVDAFGSSSIPFHLVSAEMFDLLRERLNEGGLLALNVETRGWGDPLAAAIASTARRVFDEVLALPTAEPPNRTGSTVLFAGAAGRLSLPEGSLPHPLDALGDPHEHWRVVQMNHAWDNAFEPAETEIFSDDRNRSSLLAALVSRAARRHLRLFFAEVPGAY
jgi:spermidine synthase